MDERWKFKQRNVFPSIWTEWNKVNTSDCTYVFKLDRFFSLHFHDNICNACDIFMHAIRWIVFADTWWNEIHTKTKNSMRKMNKKRNTNTKHKKKECLNGISVNKISYRVVSSLEKNIEIACLSHFRWSPCLLCTIQCRCNEWVRERDERVI